MLKEEEEEEFEFNKAGVEVLSRLIKSVENLEALRTKLWLRLSPISREREENYAIDKKRHSNIPEYFDDILVQAESIETINEQFEQLLDLLEI